jgi:hypothetical protein
MFTSDDIRSNVSIQTLVMTPGQKNGIIVKPDPKTPRGSAHSSFATPNYEAPSSQLQAQIIAGVSPLLLLLHP